MGVVWQRCTGPRSWPHVSQASCKEWTKTVLENQSWQRKLPLLFWGKDSETVIPLYMVKWSNIIFIVVNICITLRSNEPFTQSPATNDTSGGDVLRLISQRFKDKRACVCPKISIVLLSLLSMKTSQKCLWAAWNVLFKQIVVMPRFSLILSSSKHLLWPNNRQDKNRISCISSCWSIRRDGIKPLFAIIQTFQYSVTAANNPSSSFLVNIKTAVLLNCGLWAEKKLMSSAR